VIDVVVYISSVANAKKHSRKTDCLESFADGVKQYGDTVLVQTEYMYKPARLAVMLGWATTNTGGPNIVLRKQIIQEQKRLGAQTMCIDASCFKYLDNQGSYLRYSLGGPFYDKAEYANKNSDADKWIEISQALGITLNSPVTRDGGYILICMQRDGGFAMKTLDPMVWLADKIKQIRAVTKRPIVIRPHPGAYNLNEFKWVLQHPAVSVVDPLRTSLLKNLKSAYTAVYFNSSASVAAACEGLPIFVDDESCVGWDVANKSIANIENPTQFDRRQWIYDLAAAHWTDDDGRSGRIYRKFKPFLL
jgi:hypothetical protein